MKIYLRIFGYAPGLAPRLVKFFVYAIFGVMFSAGYLALTMPMLKVLFDPVVSATIPPAPGEFDFSRKYAEEFFNHHFIRVVHESGPHRTLLFICFGIVLLMIVGNALRYFERMTASRI